FERKAGWTCGELCLQTVSKRGIFRIPQTTVAVGNRSAVALQQRVKTDVGAEIVKVCIDRCLLVLIVDLPVGQKYVPYSQIKDTRVAAAALGWRRWNIILAVTTDFHMHHRVINEKFAQDHFVMPH